VTVSVISLTVRKTINLGSMPNKTDFIIIGTSRQLGKLTNFFPTKIHSHGITPSDAVRNIGVTSDSDFNFRKPVSLTCHSCFYHIRDLRVLVAIFLFQLPKLLLQHSLRLGLITATLFFITLHLRIFKKFSVFRTN